MTELWKNDCLKEQQKSVNIFHRKRDKGKNALQQWNQEINTGTSKSSINLGNSIVLQNNKETKELLMWL